MKRALVAAIALAFAVYLTPRCEAREKAAKIAARSNEQQPCALTAVLALASFADQEGPASHNDSGQNQPPSGDETAQWILVVITGITAGFICWQSWETRKAAQASQKSAAAMESQTGILEKSVAHAEKSADAAKNSADAIVNSERAWLTVKVRDFEEPAQGDHMIWVEIPIKNHGRTPARVKNIVVTNKLVPFPPSSSGRPGQLPETPVYDTESTIVLEERDIIIAPADTLSHMHVYIWPKDLKQMRAREVSLYVYGYVEYFDTVKQTEHKTCFCSIYWVPERGFNEPTGFMFSQVIPAAYFCAT